MFLELIGATHNYKTSIVGTNVGFNYFYRPSYSALVRQCSTMQLVHATTYDMLHALSHLNKLACHAVPIYPHLSTETAASQPFRFGSEGGVPSAAPQSSVAVPCISQPVPTAWGGSGLGRMVCCGRMRTPGDVD